MAITAEKIEKVLTEKWDEVKAAIRARWGDKVSDADLDGISRQHEEICHLIGGKCGLSQRKAREEVNKVLDGIIVSRGG